MEWKQILVFFAVVRAAFEHLIGNNLLDEFDKKMMVSGNCLKIELKWNRKLVYEIRISENSLMLALQGTYLFGNRNEGTFAEGLCASGEQDPSQNGVPFQSLQPWGSQTREKEGQLESNPTWKDSTIARLSCSAVEK